MATPLSELVSLSRAVYNGHFAKMNAKTFSCIYFAEDKSLTVVDSAHKDLSANGPTSRGSLVQMMWKVGPEKKKYDGVVIDSGESFLSTFLKFKQIPGLVRSNCIVCLKRALQASLQVKEGAGFAQKL